MKKILTIDGGGIRGVFPAAFLAELEKDLGKPIGEYFDLIAGTSTGGIIAIGLGLGMSAQEILHFYEIEGPKIFDQESDGVSGKLRSTLRTAKQFFWAPKYSTDELKQSLYGILGDRKLGESSARLMIPSWHPKTQRVYIFKTAHNERFRTDYKELAIDAALATAAAPTVRCQSFWVQRLRNLSEYLAHLVGFIIAEFTVHETLQTETNQSPTYSREYRIITH